jgi:hypothetical protein
LKEYILTLDFKDGLGILMDAMFSIPMVLKSGVSPLLDFEAFISSANGM